MAYYGPGVIAVSAFWLAYMLTRPLGASPGNLLTRDVNGGPGIDIVTVNPEFMAAIVSGVTYLVLQKERMQGLQVNWQPGAGMRLDSIREVPCR